MSTTRSRISHRHLLALCTFLVPLGALAILGQSELQRQTDALQAAVGSEANLFLAGAAQAFEQQIDRQLPPLLEQSQQLIAGEGAIRATLKLREAGFAALLNIILVDEKGAVAWPQPAETELGLPFARDPRRGGKDNKITLGLKGADLLLTAGDFAAAERLLLNVIARLEKAEDSGGGAGLMARFRLATVQRKLGRAAEAHAGFEYVQERVFPDNRGPFTGYDELGALSEIALAEIGGAQDRVDLLDRIATSGHYSYLPDGMRTAMVERLVEGIPVGDVRRDEFVGMMHEERQRAQTRTFAGDYNELLSQSVSRLLRRTAEARQEAGDLQVVATLGDTTTLLWVREATKSERERYRGATRVALHIDLDRLMAPALEPYIDPDGASFVLAVHDPERIPLVEPPETVPTGFVAPSQVVSEMMTLSAWPADAERLLSEANARTNNRFLLMLTLFGAGLAGALWLWRSVTREAELATLKVDLVSRVSHELKTPLALIRMYGETLGLGRARDGEQAQHFGSIIARESERLTTMIQRILDFSRQQAGTLSYAPRRIELTALLHGICDAYTPHLEARGAVLVDTVRGEVFVDCDENACESAVVNLLENAAKYAIEGDDDHAIELDLLMVDGDVIIEVRDRGRGIPAAEAETVFDPFYRATNSGEVRGAGIGLSLVRHFARAHGGDATAAPRPGGGAVFRLTLPIAKAAQTQGGKPRQT